MLDVNQSTIKDLHHQRGIALIESLVAMVVVALGILGVLGLQMRTLTDTQGGARRAQAIRLIEDLGERLQNNPNSLGNLTIYTTKPDSSENCQSAACAPEKLAAYDIKQWHSNVEETLPGGKAIVFIPEVGSRQLGVMIGWNENRYTQSGQSLADTALNTPFRVFGTEPTVSCPGTLTCHLQFIQPSQRCTPTHLDGGILNCLN